VWLAVVIAVVTVGTAFLALWGVYRLRLPALGEINPFLCLITNWRGFASLSQFQIILWTFLVIASAAYVFALCGDLIPITSGTLVLLGISGTATVISKVKTESDAAAPPRPADPAAAAADAEHAATEAAQASSAAANARAAVATAAATDKPKAEEDAKAAEANAEAKWKAAAIVAGKLPSSRASDDLVGRTLSWKKMRAGNST